MVVVGRVTDVRETVTDDVRYISLVVDVLNINGDAEDMVCLVFSVDTDYCRPDLAKWCVHVDVHNMASLKVSLGLFCNPPCLSPCLFVSNKVDACRLFVEHPVALIAFI